MRLLELAVRGQPTRLTQLGALLRFAYSDAIGFVPPRGQRMGADDER